MTKYLIVNADDFGWDLETSEKTIELLDRGPLTSATIMTGRPGTEKALAYAVANQDRFSFGLHFNLVDGHPAFDGGDSNSLCDGKGFLKESNRQRKDALLFRLNPRDIAKEFRYQCEVLTKAGIHISHIDSHGHLHKFPQILRAVVPVMKDLGIARMRRAQNLYQTGKSWKKRQFDRVCSWFIPRGWSTDSFFMLEHHHDSAWLKKFIKQIPAGTTELGVHPGLVEQWRSVETLAIQKSSAFNAILGNGVQLRNWRE